MRIIDHIYVVPDVIANPSIIVESTLKLLAIQIKEK